MCDSLHVTCDTYSILAHRAIPIFDIFHCIYMRGKGAYGQRLFDAFLDYARCYSTVLEDGSNCSMSALTAVARTFGFGNSIRGPK